MSREDEPPQLARRASRTRPVDEADESDDDIDDDAPELLAGGPGLKTLVIGFFAGAVLIGVVAVGAVALLKRPGKVQPEQAVPTTPSPSPQPSAAPKQPAPAPNPSRGRLDESVGIDGVFVHAGASVMAEEGNRLLLMVKVETSVDCSPRPC